MADNERTGYPMQTKNAMITVVEKKTNKIAPLGEVHNFTIANMHKSNLLLVGHFAIASTAIYF